MNLDDRYIFVFIRQNMFPDHQMVHSFHLGFLIGKAVDGFCQKRHTLSGHPIVLVYGKAGEEEILAAGEELRKLGIEFIEWRDPDSKPEHDDYGLTGIVSEPVTKTVRNKLSRHRAWSASNNIHPFAAVAQEREHPDINREVGS